MDINIKRLIRDLSNTDEDLRALSAMTLMKTDILDPGTREEVIPALMKSTRDKNVSVRFFSRKAIHKLKRQKIESEGNLGIPPLDEALASDDFEDRLQAVMAIAKEKKAEFKDRLMGMLQSEHHDFVKASLISCLKMFLSKEEARVLSRFLQDPDNRVRSNTIEALEHLKIDEAIPLLFPSLEDPDNRIRAVAAKALQAFGEEKVFSVLKKMLSSAEEWMKVSAVYSLSHINSGAAIQLLLDSARPPVPPETRFKAIIALANYYDSAAFGFLKLTANTGEEPYKGAANKSLKLMEEKFGSAAPTTSLIEKEKGDNQQTQAGKEKSAESKPQDLGAAVTQFFRKGKDEAIGLSQKAAISFGVTDLEKEQRELLKEAGRVLFEIYQKGDLKVPELLTICHEVLRMNFFIQKYTDEEEKRASEKSGGFFSQLKALFSHAGQAKNSPSSQVDKFTQKREDLLLKLGETAFFKIKIKEFLPAELEGYYQAYLQIGAKILKEKGKK